MVLIAHLRNVDGLAWMPDFVSIAGVGIFFALSGFLITRILLSDRAVGRGLNEFYTRRVARICPIYYLLLLLLFVVWPGREVYWAASYTLNFRYLANAHEYFQTTSGPPIAHVWSLCVEEHFYWVWPTLLMILPFRIAKHLPLLVILTTPLLTWWLSTLLQYNGLDIENVDGLLGRITLTQMTAISLGALTAIYEPWVSSKIPLIGYFVPRSTLVGIGLLGVTGLLWIGACLFCSETQRFVGSTFLHLVCGGVFLIVLGLPGLGRLRWLRNVGAISYGLYLFHLPIYGLFGLAEPDKSVSASNGIMALALTFGVAIVSYRLLERPIIAWARSNTSHERRPVRIRLSVGAALTILIASVAAAHMARAGMNIYQVAVGKDPATLSYQTLDKVSPERIETLVVGPSHAQAGIATPELRRDFAWNSASPSQDLWYDCKIVRRDITRMPRLKRVLFVISAFSFRFTISESPRDGWREACYWRGKAIASRRTDRTHERYGSLAILGNEELVLQMRRNDALVFDELQGWLPNKSVGPMNLGSGPIAACRHDVSGPEAIDENMGLLLDTIDICKSRGIQCTLVSTPKHPCYRNALRSELVEESSRLARNICDTTKTVWLDYSTDPRFVDEDFSDGDHLARDGAIKFSQILNRDLERVVPGRIPQKGGVSQQDETKSPGEDNVVF